MKLFCLARDNAVAALGKILIYQSAAVSLDPGLPGDWLELMPITHDTEEAVK